MMQARHVYFWCAAGLCGAFTAISAHYGYSLSEDPLDKAIVAFLFGLMTAGGSIALHGSLRAWRLNKAVSAVAFLVATATLMVSLSISVGSWASRNSEADSEHQGTARSVESLQKELDTKQISEAQG